jgi:acetylornithine deacetylase/succinyl-diaminopimelate desuccinylase-like protein
VYNPAQLVADIISAMHDEGGKVLIPGFYNKVRLLTQAERDALFKVPYGQEEWRKETGLTTPWGEDDYTLLERIGARPTCEVNGIYGGFMEEGAKTVIPATAGAKVSMRLVADQDPAEIARLFSSFVRDHVPEDYSVEIINHSGGSPMLTPMDSPEMEAAKAALEAVYGKPAVFVPMGGSIPIGATFQQALGASIVFIGFGLDDNIHAPNEHFRVDQFYKGMETIAHFIFNIAR